MVKRPSSFTPDDPDDADAPIQSNGKRRKTAKEEMNVFGGPVLSSGDDASSSGSDLAPPTPMDSDADGDSEAAYVEPGTPPVDEDQEATQHARRDAILNRPTQLGKIAECGIIEQIDLENFMCHKLLTVKLGPQCNFIVGNNGSGKSAILTAITLALGGKAAATNRGSSTKNFIRQGATSARIIVRIKNRGSEAYEPERFGNSIFVERSLRADGSGGYKLRGTLSTKILSTSKADIDKICDHARLRIDNPLNVLTQDEARSFLSASTPKQKYSWFLKGTQIETLKREYAELAITILNARSYRKAKEATLEGLKDASTTARARMKSIEDLAVDQQRLGELRGLAAWQEVTDHQDVLHKQQEKIESHQITIKTLHERIEECSDRERRTQAEVTKLGSEQTEIYGPDHPAHQEYAKCKANCLSTRKELIELRDEGRKVKSDLAQTKDQVAHYEKKIAMEIRKQEENESGQRRRQALDKIAQLEQDKRLAAQEKQAIINSRMAAESQSAITSAAFNEAKNLLQAAEEEAERARMQVMRYSRQGNDPLAAYDSSTAKVRNAINSTSWHQKPVGPLGVHVSVIEPKWTDLLETIFDNNLEAYGVTNRDDETKLTRILRQFNCRANILRTTRESAAFKEQFLRARPAPQPGRFICAYDLLRFDDEFAEQLLVNAVSPEQAILVDDKRVGDELMRYPKQGMQTCFSSDGYKIGGLRGGSLMTPLDAAPRGRLNKSAADLVRRAKGAHEQAAAAVAQHKAAYDRYDAELTQMTTNKNASRKRMTSLDTQIIRFEGEIAKCQETATAEVTDNTAVLMEAKVRAEADYARILEQATLLEERRELASQRGNAAQAAKDAAESTIRELDAKATEAADLFAATAFQVEKARVDREHYELKLAKAMTQKDALNEQRQQVEDAIQVKIRQAEEVWRDPDTLHFPDQAKTAQQYRVEITALTAKLKSADKKRGMTIEECQEELHRTDAAYTSALNSVAGVKTLLKALSQAYERRNKRLEKIIEVVTERARVKFFDNLVARGFSGSLIMDHREKLLHMRISTENVGDGERRDKDVRSLSGGEKSFSTICLLLSLWDAAASSLRALDEFDVFMDVSNRNVSMKMITDNALACNETQFILISPQGMGTVQSSDAVRMVRLNDPMSAGHLCIA
ncbi:hypothetical protein E5Q_02772 [Mixia osmundae IAM 14324]|uniref:RecF/RecN/SMC N-terminal domain-containing protein n=1 Tax=Mixia osmundae (strain CBS 9802 / IAM 14324 / JCM 22182 / KY 12970) TaxID=764103 RepID=G7DZV1_MIXOS|nr:hypothetical protein E5Q_02772 [Mixia osmundae IAM 14324]